MAIYRLYCMDGAGHIRDAEWFEAADDAAALKAAAEMHSDAMRCEVWCGTRLVGALDRPKEQGA